MRMRTVPHPLCVFVCLQHSVIGHDAVRLQVIFSELKACKDDSQQRGWALHEDEAVIIEYLEELLSILVLIRCNTLLPICQ